MDVIFHHYAVGFSFFICLFGTYIIELLQKFKSKMGIYVMTPIFILFSLHSIASGIYLLNGWEQRLANVNLGYGKGRGIIALIIELWPYILILVGAMQTFISGVALKAARNGNVDMEM